MSKIGTLRDLLLGLLAEHERDGRGAAVARFLYYELVQHGQLSKERKGARRPDQIVHDALTDLREDGRVPWNRARSRAPQRTGNAGAFCAPESHPSCARTTASSISRPHSSRLLTEEKT